MDVEQSWQVIEQQRLRLAALLDGLTEEQWDRPSLCTGWRVRDVAAHLVQGAQTPPVRTVIAAGLRAGGRFHRVNHDLAVRHAESSGPRLAEELRAVAGSRELPVITNHRNILFDVLVHSQDIAIPLGISYEMPPEAARAGADRVWTMGWPFWARRRFRDHRLVATDVDWSAGSGAEIRGPIAAMLLTMTGRTALLDQLSGEHRPTPIR